MTPDIRAAAERLIEDDKHDVRREWEFIRDGVALARAWLAENPADDSLPIDEPWLRSVGFEDSRDGVLFHPDMDGFLKYHTMENEPPHFDWKLEPPCSTLLAVIFTRGQLRRLAAAIGIQLREAQHA